MCATSPLIKIDLKIRSEEFNVNIESPLKYLKASPDLCEFSGWILIPDGCKYAMRLDYVDGESHLIVPSILRPDVVDHFFCSQALYVEVNCGFNEKIKFSGLQTISIVNSSEVTPIWSILHIPFGGVLSGSDGFLFLESDSNDSKSIVAGVTLLTSDSLLEYEKFFDCVKDFSNLFYLVAPSKEVALAEFYPGKVSDYRIVHQISEVAEARGSNFCYPINRLANNHSAFVKTDSHWSDFGAFVALEDFLNFCKINVYLIPFEYSPALVSGDLGIKVDPVSFSLHQKIIKPSSANLVFDNERVSSGHFVYYRNSSSLISKKLIIFGSSSSLFALSSLKEIFSQVYFIYSAASIVIELIDLIDPDYILAMTNERFLARPPIIYSSIYEFKNNLNIESISPFARNVLINRYSISDVDLNLFDLLS